MIPVSERINNLEWRLKRLEKFIGKSGKKTIIETMNNLNDRVLQYTSDSNYGRKLIRKADEITRLTSADFQRNLMEDQSSKLELILADEERIRHVTKNLSEIDTLARVLDEACVQDIPKLFGTLNKLLSTHDKIKNEHRDFTDELTTFLQDYAAFILMMDENLQQYKSINF